MNGPISVLYVDDDPSNVEILEKALPEVATVARTGPDEAAVRLDAESVDCVVVGPNDEAIRVVDDRSGSVPVVALVDDERSARAALEFDPAVVASLDEPPGVLRARLANVVEGGFVDGPNASVDAEPERSTASERRGRHFAAPMLDALDDLVYAFDTEGFVHWNDRLTEVTGRTDDELSRLHPPDLFESESAARVAATIATCDEESLPVTIEADLETAEGAVPYEFTNSLLSSGDQVVGVVGVGRDVTERRRTERTLERLLEATRELMSAEDEPAVARAAVAAADRVLGLSHVGIHLVDETGERLEPAAVTDATEATLGTVPTLERGESLAWEVFESGADRIYEDVHREAEVHNPETDLRSEMIFSLGEHGVMIVSADGIDEFDDADVYFTKLLAATITAALGRARREADLEYKNDQLEEFVGVVSHDLRNPLGVAKGHLELARETGDETHLDRVRTSHERMEQIIDDLLVLAREGRAVGERRPVELAEVARRAWGNVESADATLELDAADRTVVADEGRLEQLFENAFRNAIEHGGDDVRVSVEADEAGAGFAVADDGPGIPPAERDSVFEPGYTDADDGTGFGMAIIESVAEGHGWRCELEESDAGGLRLVVHTDEDRGSKPKGR